MIDKDIRMENIKQVIIKKINNITDERQLTRLYSELIGCVECTFQFTCDKRKRCDVTMLKYIKTGRVI